MSSSRPGHLNSDRNYNIERVEGEGGGVGGEGGGVGGRRELNAFMVPAQNN